MGNRICHSSEIEKLIIDNIKSLDQTQLGIMIMMLFSPHAGQQIDINRCLVLYSLRRLSTPQQFNTLVKDSEVLATLFNQIGQPHMWKFWLESQLNERSVEIKYVKGCERLAELVINQPNMSAILQHLVHFCETSGIIEEIFNGED